MNDSDSLAQLFDELCDRVVGGEQIDREWISERYPDFVHEIDELLPTLQLLLDFGQSSAGARSPAKTPPPDLPGTLGDYRLLRELGRGGMGVVYEVEQLSLGRRVALKILPFAALLDERQLERFTTEVIAAARLQHSHIVPIYKVGCERGIHFYTMQLIDGPSLAEVIAELRQKHDRKKGAAATGQRVDMETVANAAAQQLTRGDDGEGYHYRAVARIGREVAEALHHAHEHAVLHRDIKPSNLLLDAAGHVWIADFGLARVEDESRLTRTGDILGTLRYMSPEQARGQSNLIDARSDVYSLGVTLYELTTLQPVFNSADRRHVIRQVVASSPVAPHKIDHRIPRPLSCVIGKATARRPDDRYQSAQELAEDLQRFLDGQRVRAKRPTPMRRAREWSRRQRLASAATAGLLFAALSATAITHHYSQRNPSDSQSKGDVMKPSTAGKVASAVAAITMMASETTAKKPPKPPPPEPLTVYYEALGESNFNSYCQEGGLIQQLDGSFVNVGSYWGQDPMLAQVTKWNFDGTIDTGFGVSGTMIHDFGSANGMDHAFDVTAQLDNKIVIVGTSDDWSATWIARLNPDGSFDESFGNGDGIVDNLFPNDYVQFKQVTLLWDGSIVVAGNIFDNTLLVKFDSFGNLDALFGIDGVSVIDLGAFSTVMWGKGFSELPDGRLVAPGSLGDTSAVFMFTADGFLDTSFGNGGVAEIDFEPGGAEFFHALAVQPDGKIVAVGGTSTDPSLSVVWHNIGFVPEKFSIARFNADGSLDKREFVKRYGGMQLDLDTQYRAEFSSVELLSDGRILAVGHGRPQVPGRVDIYLSRFQTDGKLDTSFDDDGWININVFGIDSNPGLVILDDHNYMIGATGKLAPEGPGTPYLLNVWEE